MTSVINKMLACFYVNYRDFIKNKGDFNENQSDFSLLSLIIN